MLAETKTTDQLVGSAYPSMEPVHIVGMVRNCSMVTVREDWPLNQLPLLGYAFRSQDYRGSLGSMLVLASTR